MRVLVFAVQGLGDSLEITPMLAALRRHDPGAHVTVVTMRGGTTALFRALPELADAVVELPYWDGGRAAFLRAAAREIPRVRADRAFLPYPAARLEYLLLLQAFRAGERFAHRYGSEPARRALGAGIRLVPVRAAHNVLRNDDLLRAAGIVEPVPSRYVVPHEWIGDGGRDPGRLLIHPGTIAHDGLESRRWAPERFAEVASRWIAQGGTVGVVCGPSDEDAVAALRRREPRAEVVRGPLGEVARALSNAGAVLANDSGIAHLAAGVGARVLALFGPTPAEHGPWSPDAIAFRPSACPPCFDVRRLDTSCARGIDYACLKADLTVDQVEAALRRLTDRAPAVV